MRKIIVQMTDIPAPILFHALKHHVGHIRNFIQTNAEAEDDLLRAQLRTIGSSQLDLYLGKLSPQQIAHETILYLQAQQAFEPDAYQLYLSSSETPYQLLDLSDGSKWVLRWGVVAGRHIHLHPARYSAYTWRVKANTLKTAVAVRMGIRRYRQPLSLELVNQVRTLWLGLPPIPAYLPDNMLVKLVCLLDNDSTPNLPD